MTTYLSGIISNTVSIANEDVFLTGDVQVSGTLNIGENVKLDGQGYSLQSFSVDGVNIIGSLSADDNDQYLKNIDIYYAQGNSTGNSSFNIENYYLEDVKIQEPTGNGVYGSFTLKNNTIKSPMTTHIFGIQQDDVEISNNTFLLEGTSWVMVNHDWFRKV